MPFFLVGVVISCTLDKSATIPMAMELIPSPKATDYRVLTADTLWLAIPEVFGQGSIFRQGSQLVFADQSKVRLHRFDTTGAYLSSALRKGDGPSEVFALEHFIPVDDTAFIVGSGIFLSYFANDSSRVSYSMLNMETGKSLDELFANPNPDWVDIYQPQWPTLNAQMYSFSDSILFFPIITRHVSLNAHEHLAFYATTKNLGKLDPYTGLFLGMGGLWPEVYTQQAFIPNLAESNLIASEGEVFVSFMADSLIHVYDYDFQPLYQFGRGIEGMKTSFNRYEASFESYDFGYYDMVTESIYGSVYADKDYVCRIGLPEGTEKDGILQVYRRSDYALIAELEVPARCKVIGRIGRYYYADGIVDEEQDRLGVLKFLLP
jgi:hypothetical protein